MKRLCYIMILSFLVLTVKAQEKNFIDQNFIEVTGKAKMEVIPDEIYITILLREQDTKNKITVSELEQKMLRKLNQIGIDTSKDLLIKDMTSNFKNMVLRKNVLLTREYELLVKDGKTAAQVFMELEKEDISNVNISRLESSKIEEHRRQVKLDAIVAAKEKAGALAEAIDQSIGKALYIREVETPIYPQYNLNSNAVSGAWSPMDEAQDLDFEKIELEYSILCRFELKE